ncbi:unnamed protein product [Effrenium voratum]|nr:unnamed protein product [Effrenium voratum]
MAGPDPMSDLTLDATDILLLVSLLAICLVVNNVIQKQSWPIPEAISTIALGIAMGAVAVAFPEVNRNTFRKLEDMSAKQFMLVFIAPIIFAEGYGMKSQQFFDNITRILLHAFLGTLISALVVGLALQYLAPLTGGPQLGLAECLAFGAMISSTDPVTTLAIFKEQRLAENGRGHLYYSVLGESILNDAVAITLFDSFCNLVRSGEALNGLVALRILLEFCEVFLASTAIGVAGGLATAFLLKSARLGAGASEGEHFYFNIPEIGVALVLAYVPFLVAEACNMSGIVAIMFTGITTRQYAHFNLTQITRQIFLPTVELIASLCETYVFILLGLGVFLLREAFSLPLILWTLAACLVGRALNVYPLSLVANRLSSGPKMSFNELHMVWMAGLRGVIAFICALGFPNEAGHQDQLLCTTVITVMVSLVFLGWPTAPVLRCLRLDAAPEAETARAPRTSWSAFPGSGSVRQASARLKKLLMTQDAIAEDEMSLFEEANGASPEPRNSGMGCSFDAPRARLSAPGALGAGTFDEARLGRLSTSSARPGRMSLPSRSSRMLCNM